MALPSGFRQPRLVGHPFTQPFTSCHITTHPPIYYTFTFIFNRQRTRSVCSLVSFPQVAQSLAAGTQEPLTVEGAPLSGVQFHEATMENTEQKVHCIYSLSYKYCIKRIVI